RDNDIALFQSTFNQHKVIYSVDFRDFRQLYGIVSDRIGIYLALLFKNARFRDNKCIIIGFRDADGTAVAVGQHALFVRKGNTELDTSRLWIDLFGYRTDF